MIIVNLFLYTYLVIIGLVLVLCCLVIIATCCSRCHEFSPASSTWDSTAFHIVYLVLLAMIYDTVIATALLLVCTVLSLVHAKIASISQFMKTRF